MARVSKTRGLPVEFVFAPDWWHRHYGVSFDEDYFWHPVRRVEAERDMRRALRERFPKLYGSVDVSERPVAGPMHLAAGFVLSEIMGCEVVYHEGAPPDVIPRALTDLEFMGFQAPDLDKKPVMLRLRRLLDDLEARFGYVEGDFNWSGILNLGLDLRGQALLLDFYDRPEAAKNFLDEIARCVTAFVDEVKRRTHTTSVSVNRSILGVNPALTVHSNCSVQMVSAQLYREQLLAYDVAFSKRFQPYGIHHCGDNMHALAPAYADVPGVEFYDVGWGSDVAACRAALPEAFLNLRLSPVRFARCQSQEILRDTDALISSAGRGSKVGICCINIDSSAPDANVRALVEYAHSFE